MWILRYLILADRNRGNFLLDRRTRMAFDPLHACPVYICQDKSEWDEYGRTQVQKLENELRMDIEAFNTVTGERRRITSEVIEVRPAHGSAVQPRSGGILPPSDPVEAIVDGLKPLAAGLNAQLNVQIVTEPELTSQGALEASEAHNLGEAGSIPAPETNLTPPATPEPPAEKVPMPAAPVSSGEEAQAESEPDAAGSILESVPATPKPKAKTKPAAKAAKKGK